MKNLLTLLFFVLSIDLMGQCGGLTLDYQTQNCSCHDKCDGAISVTISGGQPPYMVSWADTGPLINPEFRTFLCRGDYKAAVIDANGCTLSATITITAPPCLNVDITTESTTCGNMNGSITAMPSGGHPPYYFEWSNNAGTPTLNNLQAGIYLVTVTDGNGCSIVRDAFLPAKTPISVYYSVTDITPPNTLGAIDILVTGGVPPYTYHWYDIPTFNPPADRTIYSAGVYCLDVTDATGCKKTTCITVEEKPASNCSVNISVLPNGDLAALSNGLGLEPLYYTWSNQSGSLFIQGTADTINTMGMPGTYCVTVTNGLQTCVATDCIAINAPPLIANNEITRDGCGNDCTGKIDLTVTGGFAPGFYNYNWSNNQTTEDISNLCSGLYTVTISSYYSDALIKTYYVPESIISPNTTLYLKSSNPDYCNATGDVFYINNCEKVCPGTTVTYSVEDGFYCYPLISPVSWEVTGASSYTISADSREITITWGSAGAGLVTFIATNSYNCQKGSRCIEITPPPKAKFTTAPSASGNLQVCKGQNVTFLNQSTGADLYEWQFSDNLSNTTETSPEHTYNQPGTFTVLLIARTECLCADSAWLTVEVLDAISPLLDCASTICPGEEVTYTANASCGQYNWNISPNGTITGGGGTGDNSVTIQWNTGTEGIIALNATACSGSICPATAVTVIPILSDDAEITGDTHVCPQTEATYQITLFKGSNYVWSVKPGTGSIAEGQGREKVTVRWTAPADTWIAVEYDNCYLGCKGRDTLLVKIRPPFAISGEVEKCANTSGTFYTTQLPTGTGVSCLWQIYQPDGALAPYSPTAPFANIPFNAGAGNYRLLAVPAGTGIDNTCSDSAEWHVNIKPNPPALISISGPSIFCAGQPANFKATSSSSAYNIRWEINKWQWAPIIDEGPSTLVTFESGSPRWISARQISTDGLGCVSDSITKQVTELQPFPITGTAALCPGANSYYTIGNIIGTPVTWTISPFNAGTILFGQGTSTIQIKWLISGIHTLSATACQLTSSLPVEVYASPVPDPDYPAGICTGEVASLNANGIFNSYEWKNTNGVTFSNNYTAYNINTGSYALVVTDDHGCKGTKEFTIASYPSPNVWISTVDRLIYCNEPYGVKMLALTDYDGQFQYEWYQYGSFNVGNDSIYYADSPGFYSVGVTNEYGCQDGDGDIKVVENCGPPPSPGPIVPCDIGHPTCPDINFDIVPSTECDSFTFQVNVPFAYMPGTETWVIRRQGISTLGTRTGPISGFRFPNAGLYIAQLSLRRMDGSWCCISKEVDIIAHAQFNVTPGCVNGATGFTDESTFIPGRQNDVSWHWDFNDFASANTDTSSLRNPSWTFTNPLIYNVELTITASTGCISKATLPVKIPDPPTVNFLPLYHPCAGTDVTLSISPSNLITHAEWDFGDPATGQLNHATGWDAVHQYAIPGDYTAIVTVTNINGCKGSSIRPFTIENNTLTGTITPSQSVICEGQSVTLTAPSGGDYATYKWNTSNTTASINVNNGGVYRVTVTNSIGCTYTPPVKTIDVNPVPDGIINGVLHNDLDQVVGYVPDYLAICAGEDVYLEVKDNGNYNYTWSGGLGTGDDMQFTTDRGNVLAVGNYQYQVTITNSVTGCTAATPVFTVDVHPSPDGFSATASQFCAGQLSTVSYFGPQPAEWSYFWNNGATGPSFQTTDPGHFFVKVINQFGCKNESNTVTIYPGPNVGAIPGGCHTRCTPDSLCIPVMPEIVSWQWYFEGVPVPGATSPQLVAVHNGSYTVAVTDTAGCNAISAPLELSLYTGFGDIGGKVWSDVNHNGFIDAGDTLISLVNINLWRNDTLQITGMTDGTGSFSFNDILATPYWVAVDTMSLPSDWKVIIGQADATLLGCDSKSNPGLLLQLPVCQPSALEVTVSVCPGESYIHDGIAIPIGGIQEFTYQASASCDSIVRFTVVQYPAATSGRVEKVCPGTAYNFLGNDILTGTSQTFTLQHPLTGCDSLVTITVIAFDIPTTQFTQTVCEGDNLSFHGALIPAGTTQQITLENPATGCDSIVTVTAVAIPLVVNDSIVLVCTGEPFAYNGDLLQPGKTYEYHYTTLQGECDSTVLITVSEWPLPNVHFTAKSSCPGDATGTIAVKSIGGGIPLFEFSLDGNTWQTDTLFALLSAGEYQVFARDAHGCTIGQSIIIDEKPPLSISLPPALLIPCDTPMILLEPQIDGDLSSLQVKWNTGDTTAGITVSDAGIYNVKVINECAELSAETRVTWSELQGIQDFAYFPNTVAPEDAKTENAIFKPNFIPGVEVKHFHLEIFDRWGELVWRGYDPDNGWDTRDVLKNQQLTHTTVFVWWMTADINWCGRTFTIQRKGDVTVLR